jgi:CheY-like chemotaxis protein
MLKHIVLIDDDDDDQFIFLTALKEVAPECECRIKNNGLTAFRDLQVYHDHIYHDHIDMIFLDLNMPMMNGFEFLTILKTDSRLSSIPIIIYSTSNNPLDVKRAKALGVELFISKTSEIQDLISELNLICKAEEV